MHQPGTVGYAIEAYRQEKRRAEVERVCKALGKRQDPRKPVSFQDLLDTLPGTPIKSRTYE